MELISAARNVLRIWEALNTSFRDMKTKDEFIKYEERLKEFSIAMYDLNETLGADAPIRRGMQKPDQSSEVIRK